LLALRDLADLPLQRYPHTRLVERIWDLRHGVCAHDAAYVALAELLGCALVTADRKLGRAARTTGCLVDVLG
jgi:predicted nucleic acid-binding protein